MNNIFVIGGFNNDECIVINSAFKESLNGEFSQKRFLDDMMFSREISTDADVLALLEGVIEKTKLLSAEEWGKMVDTLPFDLFYDEQSAVENDSNYDD